MDQKDVLTSALYGTSAMTIFSYIFSEAAGKNFTEPEELSKLIIRLNPGISKSDAEKVGWVLHYLVGILFCEGYDFLIKKKKLNPSILNGIYCGVVSGVAGIIAWNVVFKLHPNPQLKNMAGFSAHLLLAHLIFGVFAMLPYIKRTNFKQADLLTVL
jgi:hypothetical protein